MKTICVPGAGRVALGMALFLAALGCSHAPPAAQGGELADLKEADVAVDLTVLRLAREVFLHRSFSSQAEGHVSANGLLVLDGAGSILVDTGWTEAQTTALLRFAADTLHAPVRRAIVTHAHADRLGGLAVLVRAKIPVTALELTAQRTEPAALGAALQRFDGATKVGPLRLFFPGAGHAPDNIVVYHDRSGTLFGGCLVRDGDASSLGNMADASAAEWPKSLERVRSQFPRVKRVVPGHGKPGGPELLRHTAQLTTVSPP